MTTPPQNPFDPALHGGVQFDHSAPVVRYDETAAKVRWKVKGASDGPVYQGSKVYQPCIGCGQKSLAPFVPRRPKRFQIIEPEHDRAIVIPWLSTAAVWDELLYCLRAIHRFFQDQECPIRIIGDAPPAWLDPAAERVRFVRIEEYARGREQGLFAATQLGMQFAREVGWWNDDIYLIRETGWHDMRIALTEGDLAGSENALRSSNTPWQNALGEAVEELKLRGKSALRFATHTPYLFEIEKSRAIFREFYLHHKGSWVTLYHNFHATPHTPCKPYKVEGLPTASKSARYLNHRHTGPNSATKRALREMFPDSAPWEL
jgi:hypothetical protein